MENPVREVADVVHRLTQGSPKLQQDTVLQYFTVDASFTHPLCRTGSFDGSRWLVLAIFRWYKIMSPRIDIEVHSVAFDETNLLLYVGISQIFRIWLVPFYSAPVSLTTVLTLKRSTQSSTPKYLISAQNDLYQTNQFIKFVLPFGIGATVVLAWQFIATLFCLLGALVGAPFTWLLQTWADEKIRAEKEASGKLSEGQLLELKALGAPNELGVVVPEGVVRTKAA